MSDIKENIKAMAEVIKKEMKLGSGGVIEISPDVFAKTLEGTAINEGQVKAIQKHTSEFFAATALAAGEIAVPAMKKDKKLDQVSVEVPVLKDTVSHVIQRSKEVMAGMPKDGERQTKEVYGYLTSKYVNDVSGSKGEAKKVKQHIAALAEEAFGK